MQKMVGSFCQRITVLSLDPSEYIFYPKNMNAYTIKIDKNKDKKFVLRGPDDELLGMLTVRDGEIRLNGRAKLSIHVPSDDKGETKTF